MMDRAQLIKNLLELEVEDTAHPDTLYDLLLAHFDGYCCDSCKEEAKKKADFALNHFAECVEMWAREAK
jgi:hypothetical protein